MLFNSYVFMGGFLPVVFAGFALACRLGRTAAVAWLVLASLVFHGWWNIASTPVLLLSILGNFAAARLILATEGRASHAVLTTAILLNLAALGWYKYLAALLDFWRLQGGPDTGFDQPVLPLGISFFTFTQIAWLLDCHARLEPRRALLDYTLFVTFFPHLIAGPLLNGREILPAFADPSTWRPSSRDVMVGGGIFLIGLLKKTLLADPVAALVAPGFAHPEMLTLLPAWRSALAWSMQLYFDFSGYSDMAVGLARVFGVTFPANFNAPYKARSVIDYWQRWHISLTRFLMSTLHTPLTLAILRHRRARGLASDRRAQRTLTGFATMLALPVAVTMGLAGLWHGAGLTFLVFGLLHAAFLIVNHAWRLWRPNGKAAPPTRAGTVGAVLLTYLCVLTGAVIFRASTLDSAVSLFTAMLGFNGAVLTYDPRGLMDAVWLAGLHALVWGAPTTQEIMAGSSPLTWRPTLPWAAAFGAAATLGLLSIGGTGEFLYFRF